ncbi:acyl carrier protein [Periweissella beninensis]|uniref:Acyl carrier protein n=1 Tax=Periweissella beninensis TaxID=504936 RepID=A0ABT0VF77_9LACO|nr:acyl carrier protein [Periweissella beninensis]MBM7543517.1 acyl carrier protein [Periweissella beninensis]MCM2436499.1 acyl carrier protein [Periweissella beninensis]MCT4396217.1 acyl carrier protein [Periweissella beninensis]
MTEAQIFEKVQAILADQFDLEVTEIKLTTDLRNDIESDSLDIFELMNQVEDEFDIKLEVEDGINTVQELVNIINQRLAAK